MSGEMTGDGARLLAGVLWDEPSRPIDPRLVQLLIAACLVESRGESYGTYLERVFSDDPDFLTTIKQWSKEESEHGLVLATWLRRKLPQIDISTLLAKYNAGISLSYAGSAANASIRGSKTAELLSRCAVESGTSTYYKAIAESVDDQVLKLICTRLAKDEINHFSVFRRKMDELKATEQFGFLHLLKMSLSRLVELEDDQVSYAYYIGLGTQQPYGRRLYSKLMIRAAYGLYTKQRISELIKLNLRALGISKSWVRGHYDLIVTGFTHVLWCYIRSRVAIINLKLYIQRGRI